MIPSDASETCNEALASFMRRIGVSEARKAAKYVPYWSYVFIFAYVRM